MAGAAGVHARTNTSIPVRSDAGISIQIGSCFDDLGMSGYAPIDVTINNQSGQARTWTVEVDSPSYAYGGMDSMHSSFQCDRG